MSSLVASVALVLVAQTAGPEQMVGWSLGAGWERCGDLGHDFATVVGYHWPQWLVQVSYSDPEDSYHGNRLDSDVWAIHAFRLWRPDKAYRTRTWLIGLGVAFVDVGVDSSGPSGSLHDTTSDWGLAAAAGMSWPSGWFAIAEYTFGADAIVNMPDGRKARFDLDGLRLVVGRRF